MQLSWRKRIEIQPELADINNWPTIIIDELPLDKRKTFNRNRKIVSLILSGQPINKVAKDVNLSSGRISQILNRCLSGEQDECPPLTKALIEGYRITPGVRRKAISSLAHPSGSRGAFTYLLNNVPGLKDALDKMLVNSIKRKRYAQNLTPTIFQNEFLRLLIDMNWDKNKYPFDQQTLAYESCRKYFHQRIDELKMPKKKTTRIISSLHTIDQPYQEIQIDSQTQDVHTSIYLEINGQKIKQRISRVTLFLAIDVATNCHLAYHLCLTKDPTQLDLLNLLEKIHHPWKPIKLNTPNLKYESGACLPSALGERYKHAGIGTIKLDNALCHMAHSVRDYICNKLNTTLNFGLPAHPKGRNFVEYGFKLLNKYTHRFASTTGSHPHDPVKEAQLNLKHPPVLALSTFEEILSVLITAHNVTPQERLGGLSPLDVMKNKMETEFCNISYSNLYRSINPFIRRKTVNVKWLKNENRRPHINFEGLRYSGNGLSEVKLANKKIIIEFDNRDIRKLSASTIEGTNIGELLAPRTWQKYPFSIQTRKRIRKETKKARMNMSDPLSGYFALLLENKDLPKHATELVRVYREFNLESFDTRSKKPKQTTGTVRSNSVSRIPHWTPEFASLGRVQ